MNVFRRFYYMLKFRNLGKSDIMGVINGDFQNITVGNIGMILIPSVDSDVEDFVLDTLLKKFDYSGELPMLNAILVGKIASAEERIRRRQSQMSLGNAVANKLRLTTIRSKINKNNSKNHI